jgi:MFS family permease
MRRSAATRFVTGVCISSFGDWLTTFALAVVLFNATKSVAVTAGYLLVRVAPRPLGSWLGGPLGDTASPRAALVGAALVQGAVTAAIAVPLALGRGYWSIFVLVGLSQLVGGSWQPLTSAMMARLAGAESRHGLNLVYAMSMSAMMLVAPAAGALLLPVVGAVPLVVGDALSFALAAGLFLSLPATQRISGSSMTVRGAVAGGFAVVARRPVLRVITLGAFSATLVITALQAALPALASQRFGSSADAGFCWAAVGLGGVVGAVIALWPRLQRPGVILPGIVVEIACIGGVAVAGAPAVDLLLLVGNTIAANLVTIESGVIIQSEPGDKVARVQGAVSTSRYLGMTTGATLALLLALTVRWQALVVILAVVGLVILGGSALGPRESAASVLAASPLNEIPE